MLLTGRLVEAREAIEIGLATRRVARGETLEEAIQLATRIASFPQQAMLADRRSALHQFDLGLAAALRAETEGAMVARDADAVSGAKRFSDGAGRHGAHLEESDDRDDS
jgi:enoyl-CoA hydratase